MSCWRLPPRSLLVWSRVSFSISIGSARWRRARAGAGWDTTLGGFVIAAMLVIMGSALGSNGMQGLLMITLPGLGWLAMDVS